MRRKHRFIKWFQACTHTHLHSCTPTRLHAYTHTHLHALTLMELVIVCAIIAVSAGIIWAATSFVREKSRQTQCMNNLRQLYLAVMMYRQDWGAIAEEPAQGIWPHQLGLPVDPIAERPLAPYLKDLKVFECPNDFRPHDEVTLKRGFKHSYTRGWPWYPAGLVHPDLKWPYYHASKCGQRFVLYECWWHGIQQKTDDYDITCRWNGQIRGHYIRIPVTPCIDPL
jgi:type II secretory pathway pseudopilin PulG